MSMGNFLEEITLENRTDKTLADYGHLNEGEIRTLKVDAMPDTGAWTLVINEDVRQKLGLAIEGEIKSTLADGTSTNCPITEPVKIQWKDRSTTIPAIVIAKAQDVLLGALPLEAMDLIVDPVRQTLAGARGDEPLYTLY